MTFILTVPLSPLARMHIALRKEPAAMDIADEDLDPRFVFECQGLEERPGFSAAWDEECRQLDAMTIGIRALCDGSGTG